MIGEPTPSALVAAPEASRAAGLAHMRLIALGLLVVMAAVFVGASLLALRWSDGAPALGYVRAFAEAGMVGGLADWFAVSALFRHPLGLPIPHTAIIPRNKDRIGEALGRFMADNFLSGPVLEEQLRRLELARWGGDWLRRPRTARRVAARLAFILPDALAALPPGILAQAAASVLRSALKAVPAAPAAAAVLDFLWRDGRVQPLLDEALHGFAGYLQAQPETIEVQVRGQLPRWAPRWVDRVLAERIGSGLVDLLEKMRDPAHPWRRELEGFALGLAERLRTDPELQARAETLKTELLTGLGRGGGAGLLSGLETRLLVAAPRGSPQLARTLERLLLALGTWLAEDHDVQARINAGARWAATHVIAPRRALIGRLVARVVAGWDGSSVAEKLELQVGRDLQFIRINGALVGGLAGVAIYATARALHLG